MKRCLLIAFLFMNLVLKSQPGVNLFVYSQSFTPGIVPQRDIPSESGNIPAKKPLVTTQHFIYFSISPSITVQPKKIWINGQWYSIGKSEIVKTPVKTDVPVNRILVPATKEKVTRLHPGNMLPSIKKPFAALRKMMKTTEFILCSVSGGKTYYTPLQKIIVLDPVMGQ